MSELTIRVTKCRNADGHVYAALHRDASGFPDDSENAVYSGSAVVRGETATFVVEDLEPGKYAVAVFHDENDDGKMNMRLKIFPKEGFGLSGTLKMGKPCFEDAAFEVRDGSNEVEVEMHYLG